MSNDNKQSNSWKKDKERIDNQRPGFNNKQKYAQGSPGFYKRNSNSSDSRQNSKGTSGEQGGMPNSRRGNQSSGNEPKPPQKSSYEPTGQRFSKHGESGQQNRNKAYRNDLSRRGQRGKMDIENETLESIQRDNEKLEREIQMECELLRELARSLTD